MRKSNFFPKYWLMVTALAAALVFPLSAGAYDFKVNGLCYNKNSDGKSVTVTYENETKPRYTSLSGALNIPASVTSGGKTYSVTAINQYAFEECKNITSLNIPNSVTSVGAYAFYYCSGITTVTVGTSAREWGDYVFNGCDALTTINWNVPDGVDFNFGGGTGLLNYGNPFYHAYNINKVVFGNNVKRIPSCFCKGFSKLTSVTFGSSITQIGGMAFSGCTSLPNITIPSTVTYIGVQAFSSCKSFTSITIPNSVTTLDNLAFSNCVNLKTVVLGTGITKLSFELFESCSSLTSVTIPSSVTEIAKRVFLGCSSLPKVTIPSSVTKIDDYAFFNCYALTSITIPNSVTTLGTDVFSSCKALKTAVIGNGVTKLTENLFKNCTVLNTVTIGTGVASIDNTAFTGCTALATVNWNAVNSYDFNSTNRPFADKTSITKFTFGNTVTHIPAYLCYYLSNLNSISIPSSVTSIGIEAFTGTGWYNSQPNGVIYVGNYAYSYKGTMPAGTSITFKDACVGVTTKAFANQTNLKAVTMNNGLKTIAASAFSDCTGLTTVTIPATLTTISNGAFANCSALTRVNISDLAAWCKTDFYTITSNPLYYAKNLYLNGNLVTNLVIPSTVDKVNDYAFRGCSCITELTIPNTVTAVSTYTYVGCSGLKKVTWDVASNSISYNYINHPFSRVTSIETFIFGNSVTSIPQALCYGLSGINRVVIPASVKTIGYNVFSDCSGLNHVDIEDLTAWCGINFNNANANPLGRAKNLYLDGNLVTSLAIPDGVEEIKRYAFYGCESITSASFPASVRSIGNSAFYNCANLTSAATRIEQPQNLTYGTDVFTGIAEASTLYVPKGKDDVYRQADYNGTANPWLAFANAVPWTDGDVNFDGVVSVADVSAIYDCIINGSGSAAICDINCDGIVNTSDVSALYKIILNL